MLPLFADAVVLCVSADGALSDGCCHVVARPLCVFFVLFDVLFDCCALFVAFYVFFCCYSSVLVCVF
jgi:hypothetical protein